MTDLQLSLGNLTESVAELRITSNSSEITSINGTLSGPQCRYAKTLPSQFSLQSKGSSGATALVIDPCYWTPELPFLYHLRLELRDAENNRQEREISIGLRRWYVRGRDFWLEGRRIVLRGMVLANPASGDLHSAREGHVALIVPEPTDSLCAAASSVGVAVVADLRDGKADVRSRAEQLTWFASVLLVLVEDKQAEELYNFPIPVAQYVLARDFELPAVRSRILALEISPTEHPPTTLREFVGPMVVLQKDSSPQLATTRAACDKLQARLAPDFDLAGYFVR